MFVFFFLTHSFSHKIFYGVGKLITYLKAICILKMNKADLFLIVIQIIRGFTKQRYIVCPILILQTFIENLCLKVNLIKIKLGLLNEF